jgi:hypothetical protein
MVESEELSLKISLKNQEKNGMLENEEREGTMQDLA